MRAMHAGSLGRRLARWLALLALAGLALTCLGVYTATSLSLGERQAETLRQKQLQVRHLVAETGVPSSGALKHKLDDALVGRQDLALVLADASEQVLYAGGAAGAPDPCHAVRGRRGHWPGTGNLDSGRQ